MITFILLAAGAVAVIALGLVAYYANNRKRAGQAELVDRIIEPAPTEKRAAPPVE